MSLLGNLRTDVRRQVTRYLRTAPVAVCECNAWDNFLIQAMYPHATRVLIRPGESGARVASAIGRAARVVLIHVDVSRTDGFLDDESALYERLASRGVVTLNARANDVRKRTLHERCAEYDLPSAAAAREGPADERLMIKTNLNAAGVPERRLAQRGGRSAEWFTRDLNKEMCDQQSYRVHRRDEVPESAWVDPTLVIERYIDNPEGAFYRVYGVGPATVVAQIWTDLTIKKLLSPARRREYFFFWTVGGENIALGDASPEVVQAARVARRAAEAMRVDFHGTDCVMDTDGTVVPIDVNKTPFWGEAGPRPGVLEHLRLGLEYLQAGTNNW